MDDVVPLVGQPLSSRDQLEELRSVRIRQPILGGERFHLCAQVREHPALLHDLGYPDLEAFAPEGLVAEHQRVLDPAERDHHVPDRGAKTIGEVVLKPEGRFSHGC